MDSKQKGDAETFLNPYLVYHVFFIQFKGFGRDEKGMEGEEGEKRKKKKNDQSQLRGAEVIGSASRAPAVTVE